MRQRGSLKKALLKQFWIAIDRETLKLNESWSAGALACEFFGLHKS